MLHQSHRPSYPAPCTTSGAMYWLVPTTDLANVLIPHRSRHCNSGSLSLELLFSCLFRLIMMFEPHMPLCARFRASSLSCSSPTTSRFSFWTIE